MNNPKPVHEICINITRRCNLHCLYCYVSDFINQKNSHEKMDLSLTEIKNLVHLEKIDSVYLTGGEPFMHSEIMKIIDYFYSSGKRINIASNGLLIENQMMTFLSEKKVKLLISVREEYEETFKVINKVTSAGVDVECYHLPVKNSPYILTKLLEECPAVTKIKLLYDSQKPKRAKEWFGLLFDIYKSMKTAMNPVEITVETAFLPNDNVIAQSEGRGAFDRIQISTEGEYYYCPLLVSRVDGCNNSTPSKCNTDICPILSLKLDEEKLSSVCCFLVSSLENAIKIGKYGGVI